MSAPRFVARLRQRHEGAGAPASDRPVWDTDGVGWPNRASSRFVRAAGLRWHVQVMGSGPAALLVHGTGAATHSWAGVAPLLAERFTAIAVDLPGHGFTDMPSTDRMSLPDMSEALEGLLAVLEAKPALAVGHSAGAAILCRMSLDGRLAADRLVSLNGALLPFRGLPGQIFSPIARLAASTSLLPRLFSWQAGIDRQMIDRLIRDTGSALDAQGLEMYRRLARRPGHVAAAIAMMANWDLHPLVCDLPSLAVPLVLVTGTLDHAVRPAEARRVQALLPKARIIDLPGLGHLAHEERPAEVAELIIKLSDSPGHVARR
ncbi:MAG: alpha/beta fold hydrolase BchO [Geminicoccaceae bacterium]